MGLAAISMTLSLSDILPNVSSTLNGTGFFFGAGTSFEAGYPMISGLTKQVIGALTADERSLLDEILGKSSEKYDAVSATPNIEQIADIIIKYYVSSSDPNTAALEARLRDLVVESILSVTSPNLDYHVQFFEALKRRAFGIPTCVWVLTTNYDVLFEQAACLAGVHLENGFTGTTHRFFNAAQYSAVQGTVAASRFTQEPSLTVKLVKLHGSVSWYEENSRFFEVHPRTLAASQRRAMVLPRRIKIMDTLAAPFDSLFTVASRAIGSEFKYIATCGFNFGDDHIHQHLLMPPMQAKKCKLFALTEQEPSGVSPLKAMPNFGGGFLTHCHKDGAQVVGTTDLWKFSEFVKLF